MFDRVRHLMEELSRLSDTLFCEAPLRSAEGISAVEDLMALLKIRILYLCSALMRRTLHRVTLDRRWKHEASLISVWPTTEEDVNSSSNYCFICNRCEWITGTTAWEKHCHEHIDRHKVQTPASLRLPPIPSRICGIISKTRTATPPRNARTKTEKESDIFVNGGCDITLQLKSCIGWFIIMGTACR